MLKRNWHYILLILLIADTAYSFYQHYHMPLDGDMSGVIIPKFWYTFVLNDPLGLSVLLHNKYYAATNRFFAHWFMSKYFKTVPFVLQHFVSPINSIYWSCALVKIAIQTLIIYLFASSISLSKNIFSKEFLIAALLVVPLIQIDGYNGSIGIIDHSITYTLFYALPLSLLMLFFFPFYRSWAAGKTFKFGIVTGIFLVLSPVILTLSGPLVSPTVLIVCPLVLIADFLSNYKKNKGKPGAGIYQSINQISKPLLFYFSIILFFSLYSFYIGLNNSENYAPGTISIIQRYLLMPKGVLIILDNFGVPLFLLVIIANFFIIKKWYNTESGKRILQLYKWIAIFSGIYILLLPFGGYRDYRPYIIRYDAIMPVTIVLIFIYGLSTYFLIMNIKNKKRVLYIGVVVIFLLIFKTDDKLPDNSCEKQALKQIANSPDKIVLVNCDCTIMEWNIITDPNNSELDCELFQYWGITKDKKLYYQK